MFKNRYKYTCPDVVHYRKNQYRLTIWSTVFSLGLNALFIAALNALVKKGEAVPIVDIVDDEINKQA